MVRVWLKICMEGLSVVLGTKEKLVGARVRLKSLDQLRHLAFLVGMAKLCKIASFYHRWICAEEPLNVL